MRGKEKFNVTDGGRLELALDSQGQLARKERERELLLLSQYLVSVTSQILITINTGKYCLTDSFIKYAYLLTRRVVPVGQLIKYPF